MPNKLTKDNTSTYVEHQPSTANMSNYSEDEKINSTVRVNTNNQLREAHGGELNPGVHAPIASQKKIANPAPLGLGAFALTTFVLSLINIGANSITAPNVVVALAYGYGGLVQLLAGMWEMAVGNTFGATALSSYGGFWISFGIVLTPAFDIPGSYLAKDGVTSTFDSAFALYLWGWFFFTTCCLLLTLRSTVMFFSLFFTLDLAFLFLAIQHQIMDEGMKVTMGKTGGAFGLMAAFLAWYNMFAGMADSSNFFFTVPVIHFPWSDTVRGARARQQHEHNA